MSVIIELAARTTFAVLWYSGKLVVSMLRPSRREEESKEMLQMQREMWATQLDMYRLMMRRHFAGRTLDDELDDTEVLTVDPETGDAVPEEALADGESLGLP